MDTAEHMIMTAASPKLSAAGAKRVAPTKAPNFPEAALMPLNVERHSTEYTSDGNTKVVVFCSNKDQLTVVRKDTEDFDLNKKKFQVIEDFSLTGP